MKNFIAILLVCVMSFVGFSCAYSGAELSPEQRAAAIQERAAYVQMALVAAREAYSIYLEEVERREVRDLEREAIRKQQLQENIQNLERLFNMLSGSSVE